MLGPLTLLAALLVGCQAPAPATPARQTSSERAASAPPSPTSAPSIADYDSAGVWRGERTTLGSGRGPAPMASFETVALTPAEPPAAPRPRRAPPRDISLHHARLDNALRHIAEAGGFNLVVASDLAEPVTVELRGVEPYDALVAVANAHGVALRYERGIVVATR